MVFHEFIFISLFRADDKEGILDEDDFCHCYADFFESAILEIT